MEYLAEAVSLWMSLEVQTRQGQLLDSLNVTHPNNDEQQKAFDLIMGSIINTRNCDELPESSQRAPREVKEP